MHIAVLGVCYPIPREGSGLPRLSSLSACLNLGFFAYACVADSSSSRHAGRCTAVVEGVKGQRAINF